jgi:hypothetical protein
MTALDDAQEEVKTDMTPMIDVVFLMIIFFICIDFKVLESKLPAYLPKDKGSSSDIVEPMEQLSDKIYVAAAGTPKYPEGATPTSISPNGRPYRFVLEGHTVKWEVGPKPLYNIQDVEKELKRIASDPASRVPNKETGGTKLMSCEIAAYPGTYYEDVAKTADACNSAGSEYINFGGGLGAAK